MTIASLRTHWPRAFFLSAAVTFAACSQGNLTDQSGRGSASTGGSTGGSNTGGTSASGGTPASGGTSASGGTPASGGTSASSGGTSASSGGTSASSGGTSASSGGTAASGGLTSTGGVASSGGSSSTGGVTSSGGVTKQGGSTAAGGSTGGTTGAGGATGAGGVIAVTGLPAKADVLASMRSANDWFMTKHPDPSAAIVTDKSRPSNLWTRATYQEGLNALYGVETDATKKSSYYAYGAKWGDSHTWGMASTTGTAASDNADNQACGQAYIDLYNIGAANGDKQANRLTAITASIKGMVSSGVTSSNKWWWIDAIHMSMPSFIKLGVLNNDTTYFDGAWVMYNDARTKEGGGLWNATDGLWFRDLHYTPSGGTATPMTAAIHSGLINGTPDKTTDAYIVAPNGKGLYWSRGNGWVVAALVRVLDILPTTDSHRATYVADFQAQMRALIALQRTDGFWNESLMDPTHCKSIGLDGDDGPETSGTTFFTYGLAWGIRKGLLDAATYSAPMQKAWNGLSTVALQKDGLLGYTQSSGDRPCTEDTQKAGRLGPTTLANFDDYGVGGFLLAGSEVYQLAGN